MDNNSTQLKSSVNRKSRSSETLSPRSSTLRLLRQFARVYTCETALHPSINGLIVN